MILNHCSIDKFKKIRVSTNLSMFYSGIRFDKEGYKIPWNSKNISKEFEKQSMCFVDQYNNYVLDVTDEDGKFFKVRLPH